MATNDFHENAKENYRSVKLLKEGELVLLRKTNRFVLYYSDKMLPEYLP